MLRRAQSARLLAVDHTVPGTRLLMLGRGDAVVGSAEDNALRVADASVAEHHAVIRFARGHYFVRDLKSRGGTFLNGKRIRRARVLTHGDQLRFGGTLRYRFIDPDARKRLRHRRILRAVPIAMLVAAGTIAHFEHWDGGLLSGATVTEIVGWVQSFAALEHASAPVSVADRGIAPLKRAASTPAALNATGPSAASPPAASSLAIPPGWLARINRYRAMVGLPSVRENQELSASGTAHAQYLLANYVEIIRGGDPLGDAGHDEDRAKPGYSAAGASAAHNCQLGWGCGSYDAEPQIDHWFAGPFHRLPMLSPSLSEAGLGEAARDGCWVAALLSADLLTENGNAIDHCAFDSHSYRNPNARAQEYGRWALRSAGAVIVIPRAPLQPGARYSVTIAAHGQIYTWTFRSAE